VLCHIFISFIGNQIPVTMLRYFTLVFFVAMVALNYLANALPLNGITSSQLSDAYPNLFVPAGITFAIWGVIYLLLAAYCIVQFFPSARAKNIKISWLFIISCGFNGAWILAWHYQKLTLSLLIMAGLLITLILINLRLTDLPMRIPKAAFGTYLGWICIATIANVTTLLVDAGWEGMGISQPAWAILMIVIGALLVSLTIMRFYNPYIGLSVIWAFIGIIIKQSGDYRGIAIAAIMGILLVTVFTALGFLGKRMGRVA